MKKIADTINGNVLIEMSPDEWEYLQQKPEATVYEVKWSSLREWRDQFLGGLKKLNLSTRPFNALVRAADISTTKYERINGVRTEIQTDPYLTYHWTFEKEEGQLLGFEEWCDYVLAHVNNFYARNIGTKGHAEILQAIREYRQADSANGHKVEV